MATPNQPSKSSKPAYISNSGHMLESPPLSARVNTSITNAYNFLGLYIVSLFSFDSYTAAMTSQFNTRGPGRVSINGSSRPAYQSRGADAGDSGWGSATRRGGSGAASGGGASGAGNGGRRLGTVDDVRGPECGSCG